MNKSQWNYSLILRVSLVILFLGQMFAYNIPLPVSASSSSTLTLNGAMTTIRHVPGDYSSIQAAIDSAVSGDTILVDSGNYAGSLDFHGKDVTLQSQAGAATTAIIGSGGTAVVIGPKGKIIGFNISGGSNSFGAGMAVSGTGTIIKSNIFENNSQGSGGFGAGIGGNSASPIIEGNIFRNNSCDGQWLSGVVSFVNTSSPLIINNIFAGNPCRAINITLPVGNAPQIINNTIVDNYVGIRFDRRIPATSQIYRNNLIYHNDIGLEVDFGTELYNAVWENNLVFDNGFNYEGILNQTGINGNISVDPLIYTYSQPAYMLQPGSPAIDSGNSNGCPALDFRGIFRPQGLGCDMGAFEGYVTLVTSVVRTSPNPTRASTVDFTITFREAVTGVDTVAPFSDFALTTSGVTGASIIAVSGSGNTYTVSVNTGAGTGTIRLDVVDDDSILDLSFHPIGGSGVGNGNFTTGDTYTLDRTAPMVLSSMRKDLNPTGANRIIHFAVTFSESVSGVDASDFILTTTNLIDGASVIGVIGSGSSYNVAVETGSGVGTIRLDVSVDATVTDWVGNTLANLPYLGGESYTIQPYFYIPFIHL
jgi:hypothetical protein